MRREYREVNETRVFEKENYAGVMKAWIEVPIGTQVIECPRWLTNPVTDRRHDLTKLSDDGYLKLFLALEYRSNTPNHIDLSNTPILTFNKDEWEFEERDDFVVVQKREAESRYGEKVLDET